LATEATRRSFAEKSGTSLDYVKDLLGTLAVYLPTGVSVESVSYLLRSQAVHFATEVSVKIPLYLQMFAPST